MVFLYSGTPGSGKSLHQAKDLYDYLKWNKNHLVVANYKLNLDKIRKAKGSFIYLDNEQITPQKLVEIAQNHFKAHPFYEGAIRVYIDECQLIFNAREWNIKGRSEWLSFFTQHRKLGYDIYLIAQFDRMIDRQIRSLIEYEYIHRKVGNMGKGGAIFNLLAGGGLFVSVKMWYPLHERVGAEWFKYRKKYGQIYDTYTMLDNTPAVAGERGTPADSGCDNNHEKEIIDRDVMRGITA